MQFMVRQAPIHERFAFNSRLPTAINSLAFTYDFLSLSTSRFLRRYPCRYGYGRRYGYHPLARARRRCRTKNCTMRQPIFLFPHEPCRAQKPRRQRFGRNARALVGCDSCARPFRARCVVGIRAPVRAFTKRLWVVLDFLGLSHRISSLELAKELTNSVKCAILLSL